MAQNIKEGAILTLENFKKYFPGAILTITLDEQRVWRYFKEECDLFYFIANALEEAVSEFDDLLALINLLREIDEDLVFIDIDNLTDEEWEILKVWETWHWPSDHAFWLSMTNGLSLPHRLEALCLNQDDALEIFEISPLEYDQWLKKGLPAQIIEQIAILEAKIYERLGEWGDYCRGSVDCSDVVGIPSYETMEDYRACDRDLVKVFSLLPLYKAFCYQLVAHLKGLGIRAEIVSIYHQELRRWLSKNCFPLTVGSRLLFATYKRQDRLW